MSAYLVGATHIDALVTAGLVLSPRGGPLSWFHPAPHMHPDWKDAYQEGVWWGPKAGDVARACRRELTRENATAVGSMLWMENHLSVCHRYAEDDDWVANYTFAQLPGVPDPLLVLDAIAGYEYQSCEHPGWEFSEAHAYVQALADVCTRLLREQVSGEGWHISDRDIFRRLQ